MNTTTQQFYNFMLTTARTEEAKSLFRQLVEEERAGRSLADQGDTCSFVTTLSSPPHVESGAKRGFQWFGIGVLNRRKSIRYNCTVPVEIHQDMPGQVSIMNAVAQNISSGGMLLKCSAVLDSLSQCCVMFKMPEWFPGANRACEVMNYAQVQRAEPSGQYYGVAFKNPL
jgi:hypothetical protein